MTRSWGYILIAAIFEVMWVMGLKHAQSPLEWLGTAIGIVVSFYFMMKAGEKIPVGTVYAVFVGLGTTGTILVDVLVFRQPIKGLTLLFIGLLLIGVIGLKITSDEEKEQEES